MRYVTLRVILCAAIMVGLGASAGGPAEPLERGLVGHWRLDRVVEGGTVPDLSGHENHAGLVAPKKGPKWDETRRGRYLALDGRTYLKVPDAPLLRTEGNVFTLACLARIEGDANGAGEEFRLIAGKTVDPAAEGYGLVLHSDGRVGPLVGGVLGPDALSKGTAGFPGAAGWGLYVVSYDGLELRFYVDGRLRDRHIAFDFMERTRGLPFCIGGTGEGHRLRGAVAEVRGSASDRPLPCRCLLRCCERI